MNDKINENLLSEQEKDNNPSQEIWTYVCRLYQWEECKNAIFCTYKCILKKQTSRRVQS